MALPAWVELVDSALRIPATRLGPRAGALQVLPADPEGAARALYAALYALERARARAIVIEDVPHTDAWAAVRDRLLRAAGP